ncbi:ribonuclease H-like domain-containing protein [Lanmaoa asiatica]|nr:ribonuclease H-like domain-containing protein [Lanmaoa asiatica]
MFVYGGPDLGFLGILRVHKAVDVVSGKKETSITVQCCQQRRGRREEHPLSKSEGLSETGSIGDDNVHKVTRPSSNWFALQKSLVQHGHPRKRPKIDRGESSTSPSDGTSAFPRNASSLPTKRHNLDSPNEHVDLETTEVKNGESIAALRRMVLGKVEHKSSQTAPGKYLALDCEMVGVGIEGNESSLARVSIVDYTGAIVLDIFVRQREKVVDYRTQWSGVRSTDLAGSAKPFKEVQQTVADLIRNRILVGHAIYNDLKALLLSHPSPQVRDTQSLAYKHRVVKSRRPALRVLAKQELGIVIQGGEHNSVTDARATMALFRLYKRQWESGFRSFHTPTHPQLKSKIDDDPIVLAQSSSSPQFLTRGRKREHSESSRLDDDGVDEVDEAPSSSSPSNALHPRSPIQHVSTLPKHRKQRSRSQPPADSARRKGISSGISTVTRRPGGTKEVRKSSTRTGDGGQMGSVIGKSSDGRKKAGKVGEKWWRSLGGGRKGGIKL